MTAGNVIWGFGWGYLMAHQIPRNGNNTQFKTISHRVRMSNALDCFETITELCQ